MLCKQQPSDLEQTLLDATQQIQTNITHFQTISSSLFDIRVDIISQRYENDVLRSKHAAREILIQTFRDRGLFDKLDIAKSALRQQLQANHLYKSLARELRGATSKKQVETIRAVFDVHAGAAFAVKTKISKNTPEMALATLLTAADLGTKIDQNRRLAEIYNQHIITYQNEPQERLFGAAKSALREAENAVRNSVFSDPKITRNLSKHVAVLRGELVVLNDVWAVFQAAEDVDGVEFGVQRVYNDIVANDVSEQIKRGMQRLKGLQTVGNIDILTENDSLKSKFQVILDSLDFEGEGTENENIIEVLDHYYQVRNDVVKLTENVALQKRRLGVDSQKDLIFKKQSIRVQNLQKLRHQVEQLQKMSLNELKNQQ
ncbi:hypothetical protein SS50377_20782 [Spironucleus salmonicida]|uniref:Uncharacterized protein n=1 Tax=Spironucleus salmonicida TaxID=348837 RepID=V6LTS5_9EUKA|nr:hypothetical protein SS50377_20782 [Spironucleus salmonicida]|eukprot:EST47111.1 Hypothetical protein SS50377_12817 [Spironucleus salmonicida]